MRRNTGAAYITLITKMLGREANIPNVATRRGKRVLRHDQSQLHHAHPHAGSVGCCRWTCDRRVVPAAVAGHSRRRPSQRRRLRGASELQEAVYPLVNDALRDVLRRMEDHEPGKDWIEDNVPRSITIEGEQEYPKFVTLTITERGWHDDEVAQRRGRCATASQNRATAGA